MLSLQKHAAQVQHKRKEHVPGRLQIMHSRKIKIDQFFYQYQLKFNQGLHGVPDIQATVNSFSGCFIEAGPRSLNCGKNDTKFETAIGQGYAYYRNIGLESMHIIARNSMILDEFHTMAKIHWRADYKKKDSSKVEIEFDVIYLLQHKGNGHKIFAYITGDEQKALKEKGVI
jgi:hypothetical protein